MPRKNTKMRRRGFEIFKMFVNIVEIVYKHIIEIEYIHLYKQALYPLLEMKKFFLKSFKMNISLC